MTKWTRSNHIEGRISASNGLAIDDERRVNVAIDRPQERGGAWHARVWLGATGEPVVITTFEAQRDAKRTMTAFLVETTERAFSVHTVARRVREIEATVYQADADLARAADDARRAD